MIPFTSHPSSKAPGDCVCIIDGAHGIYVPEFWAESYGEAAVARAGVSAADVATLLQGPDAPLYWDAWDNVLNDYRHCVGSETYRLWQDGDLYEVTDSWEPDAP